MISGSSFSVATYNVHLFGGTGRVAGRPTGLVGNDEERAIDIAASLRNADTSVVGLTEVWDGRLAEQIISDVADVYPHHYFPGAANGIDDIVECLSNLSSPLGDAFVYFTDPLVDLLASQHHHAEEDNLLWAGLKNLFSSIISEDLLMSSLKGLFGVPDAWFSGLLLLSQFPLSEKRYTPHAQRADMEHYANKGILESLVHIPDQAPTKFYLTHFQDGDSQQARFARWIQALGIHRCIYNSEYPVVSMGDYNMNAEIIRPGNDIVVGSEYLSYLSLLRLVDSFRAVHPNALEVPGYTYDKSHYLSNELVDKPTPGLTHQRLDSILASRELTPVQSAVLHRLFTDKKGRALSDHFFVRSVFSRVGTP